MVLWGIVSSCAGYVTIGQVATRLQERSTPLKSSS
uniref:Glutamate decarboxylase n=1 Tax=Rhizophora mucronata TaxID=61149 RepID=A0A2P2Q8M8_RHIMU